MSVPVASGLTYDDLASFSQDDHLRRELVDGELYVSPSPDRRHQRAVVRIAAALLGYADEHGREVDLEADQVDVHRLDDAGHYGGPTRLGAQDTLTCRTTPGFSLPVAEVLR